MAPHIADIHRMAATIDNPHRDSTAKHRGSSRMDSIISRNLRMGFAAAFLTCPACFVAFQFIIVVIGFADINPVAITVQMITATLEVIELQISLNLTATNYNPSTAVDQIVIAKMGLDQSAGRPAFTVEHQLRIITGYIVTAAIGFGPFSSYLNIVVVNHHNHFGLHPYAASMPLFILLDQFYQTFSRCSLEK